MSDDDFWTYPHLSYSGMKDILDCPAKFRWRREHRLTSTAFDIGHATHALLLGVGAPVGIVQRSLKDGTAEDAEDYKSPSAREHAETLRREGKTPLLAHQYTTVKTMAEAVLAHPAARIILEADGPSEEKLDWVQDDVQHIAYVDKVATQPGMTLLVDVKSTQDASPRGFARSAGNFRYHLQGAVYRDGWAAATGEPLPEVAFIAVEKEPPFLTAVYTLRWEDLDAGALLADQARGIYRACQETGLWPGYSDHVEPLELPRWAA